MFTMCYLQGSIAGLIVLFTGKGEAPGQGLRAAGRKLGWAPFILVPEPRSNGCWGPGVVRGSPENPWKHLSMAPYVHVESKLALVPLSFSGISVWASHLSTQRANEEGQWGLTWKRK